MTTAVIDDVDKAVTGFLKMALRAEDVKVIKVARIDGGWSADAEVLQGNGFLKGLNLPTPVQNWNLYNVVLDDDHEVIFYQQMGSTTF